MTKSEARQEALNLCWNWLENMYSAGNWCDNYQEEDLYKLNTEIEKIISQLFTKASKFN